MRISPLAALAFSMIAIGTAKAAPGRAEFKRDAQAFRALMACRDIANPTDRLQCYDTQSRALSEAADSGKLVVADEAQIKEAKRDLFGFGSIKIPFLSGSDADTPTQVEAVITGLRQLSINKWEFTLDNGMRWRQTDDEAIFPRVGQPVTVKTGAMGSYWLKMKSNAVRVLREK
ncbi:hypothetical protein [uncultured Sphingomonas sp.]|uniref:hypothetical protein n=1 Tax=uncultured Sphingomonas sp. TaxID=158754 RepID=UPI0025F4AFA2|nr:hypothetical protein [uncultured Sphingomonas sp.]